jgi:glycine/D-amino acid oxidase-like deaminating enzyme
MAKPTPKRDLRTGQPVWTDGVPPPAHFPPLERNIEVDVAVIGCGVSGALAADAALQAGKSIAAFDRRGVALDSTAASTALLQFEIDQPLTTLIRRMGREKAVRAWWREEEFSDDKHRDRLLPRKIEKLRKKLGALLPQLDTEPEFVWAGCFGESPYGLPAIGPVPGAERCFAVAGFGGNGITFGAIAAQRLQRMLLGLPDPDAALFGFRS